MDGWTIGHVVAIVALVVASGCPAGDDGQTAGSGGSGDSSSSVDGSGSTSSEPTDSTSTAATDSGADACDPACAGDRYCDFQFNTCGVGEEDGAGCSLVPTHCDADDPPACGCDGVIYPNECSAAAAGIDVDVLGGCEQPPDTFVCGPKYCDPTMTYCTRTDGLGGSYYDCAALPETCGDAPSCACLMDLEFCSECEMTPDGGLSVSCVEG